MGYTYKITVFTPTYNRAYIIENLYRSLQHQTCTEFEWLVVDDGSKDDTEQLFARWAKEDNPFPIRYYKQENGGKCSAINYGLEKADGELFFTVDSDDYLTEDAIEKVLRWESEMPKDGTFCGFVANRGHSPDYTPNTILDCDYMDGNAFDLYGVVDGERAFVFYTDVHKKYLYPVFPGERFMTEAVTWNRMANDGYKMRFYNDIIWVWEYIEDGLTKAGDRLFWENPQGTGVFFREKAKFLQYSLWTKVGMWYGFVTENRHRCTEAQLAEYIGMPNWLVKPMKWLHSLVQAIKKMIKR